MASQRLVRFAALATAALVTVLLHSGAPAADPPPAQQKTVLDKVVPGITTKQPMAADTVLELLQDSASVTITIDWEKLGTRGDKGINIDLKPMPLRDMINAILKAAGAKKPAQMTANGPKVQVTAAGEKKE